VARGLNEPWGCSFIRKRRKFFVLNFLYLLVYSFEWVESGGFTRDFLGLFFDSRGSYAAES